MFDSFLVAVHVVVPMALLMGTGVLARRMGIVDRSGMQAVEIGRASCRERVCAVV